MKTPNNLIKIPKIASPQTSMYDRTLNQSRTSLTTNSSRATRIVRKRDSNISTGLARSRSKNKQDECNTSFEEYLNKQSKFFGVQNVETGDRERCERKMEGRGGQGYDRTERVGGGSAPLTLSQTLTSLQISRNSIIERGDRYIGHRPSLNQDNSNDGPKQGKQRQNRQTKGKKREPTPVKSKKQLCPSPKNNESKANSNQIFQLQLRVTGLEEIVALERKQKEKIEHQLRQALSDVQNVREILSQIQMENKILESQKKSAEEKIEKLERTVLESENNLTAAQNNLNKLRQTIKQNRLTELQAEMKKLQKANEILREANASNAQLITALSQKLAASTKELEEARKLGDLQSLASKQSMKEQYLERELQRTREELQKYKIMTQTERQKFLEAKLESQDETIEKLNEEVRGLMVKMHCLEYFKSKEVTEIKQNSEAEIKSLRVKYSKMVVELKTKKPKGSPENSKTTKPGSPTKAKTNYDIRCKCVTPNSSPASQADGYNVKANGYGSCSQEYRTSSIGNQVFYGEKRGGGEDNFLLELSPE